jgi:hypothetical protein
MRALPQRAQVAVCTATRESLDRKTWLEVLLVHDALGPDKGTGKTIVAGYEAVDVCHQLLDTAERGSLERLACQDREPDLDLVQP